MKLENEKKSPGEHTFREARRSDFSSIERLFQNKGTGRGWAAWKYRESPDGEARVFVAESADGVIQGTLAYMPRRFLIANGESTSVMLVVDVLIDTELRSQFVYLGLMEFARTQIDGAKMGVPNSLSGAFAGGPRWRVLGRYQTWQFPVAIGIRIENTSVALFAPILNVLSKLYAACWLSGNRQDLCMQPITRFAKDYTLDSVSNHGDRSAAYLNWRFIDNPISNHVVHEFKYCDESLGYCVLTRVGAAAVISDFVAIRLRKQCFRLLVEHCRENDITQVSYEGMGLDLGTLGCMRRGQAGDCVATELPDGRYFVNACDTDSERGRALADAR